jgi:hypothetical protein
MPHRREKRLLHAIGSIVRVAYQAIHSLPDCRAMVPDNFFPNGHLGRPFRGKHSSSLTLLVAPQPQDSAKSEKNLTLFRRRTVRVVAKLDNLARFQEGDASVEPNEMPDDSLTKRLEAGKKSSEDRFRQKWQDPLPWPATLAIY